MASSYFIEEFQRALTNLDRGLDTYSWRGLLADFVEWRGDGELTTPEYRHAMDVASTLLHRGIHPTSPLYYEFINHQRWYTLNIPLLPLQ
jgi:hypothetical protein